MQGKSKLEPSVGIDLSKSLDLTCPICQQPFHRTLGWFTEHSELVCPGCGAGFRIEVTDRHVISEAGSRPHSFFTKIAGVSYRNSDGASRQAIIKRCQIGEELSLVREPNNSIDKNAIKAVRQNGEQLGYVPAHVAANGLADQLDGQEKIRCRISDLTGGDGLTRGVNIEVGTWEEPNPPLVGPDQRRAFSLGPAWVLLLLVVGGFIYWLLANR